MCGICVADQMVNSPPAARVDDDAARLHERRDEPLLDVPPLDDHLGVRERLVDVAAGAGRAESKTQV